MAKTKTKKKKTGKSTGSQAKKARATAKRRDRDIQARASAAKEKDSGPNPYDVFQNRRCKKAVLGERVVGQKRDLAKSRAAALVKRAEGIRRDRLLSEKKSKFKDARVGGPSGSKEEGNVKRLVKLRKKEAKKSFALEGADEELTIGGRALSTLADEELEIGGQGSDAEDDGRPEPAVDDVVMNRIKTKVEAQREREEKEELRQELDSSFKDIIGQLAFHPPKAYKKLEHHEPDGYDLMLRQLSSDRTVTATNRTKSPEELALERAHKLEALERERARRADPSLGKEAEEPGEKEDGAEAASTFVSLESAAAGLFEGGEPLGADDEEEDDDDEEGEEEPGEGEEEEEAGEEAEDEDDKRSSVRLLKAEELSKVDIMANTKDEEGLPYAPDCPNNMRAVEALVGSHPPETVYKLVQRIRACSAAGGGRRMQSFLTALLEYLLHTMARSDGDISAKGIEVAYALRTPLLELAGEHPDATVTFFRSRLESMGPSTLPRASELSFLKLVTMLFPVSDFQHPITTPASVLADHWAERIASLGTGIGDLVSEGVFLWEIVFQFIRPACRFCAAFFKLGTVLLECCLAQKGREHCTEAAGAILALFAEMIRAMTENSPPSAIVAANELLLPTLEKVDTASLSERLAKLLQDLKDLCNSSLLTPLTLFKTAPAQIKVLDPVFHELGTSRSYMKSTDTTEAKQLERKVKKERKSAMRQLTRDAAALQQLQAQKDSGLRTRRLAERKRVRTIMAQEKQMIKELKSENTTDMDTSLRAYSAKKADKKANRRMAGNITEDNKGEREGKAKRGAAAGEEGGKPTKKKGRRGGG